jgi:fumarylacetoacetase
MSNLNETHDKNLKSWVETANSKKSEFPIQNLPFGIFKPIGSDDLGQACIGIGDQIVVLEKLLQHALLSGKAEVAALKSRGGFLNPLMELGQDYWFELRKQVSAFLKYDSKNTSYSDVLIPFSDVEMCMPAEIGDYTDFYSSINHATNVGKLFRPDNPLLPNYKHIPIAYHGRSSSIRVSGHPTRRPIGQVKNVDTVGPVLGVCNKLDYETELGVFVGPGNTLGERISIDQANEHIFGCCVLNDWSARDIQAWEYQPLGPFLAKNFSTTISPWIVTSEALIPYRCKSYKRPSGDPEPLPYLNSPAHEDLGGLDIQFEVAIRTEKMRQENMPAQVIGQPPFRNMYWTISQMLTHHTINGCNLRPGDFYGSGTISGSEKNQLGSLLEVTAGGKNDIAFPSGEKRKFLEDGDEVIMRAWCGDGDKLVRIGFGECRTIILSAPEF